MNSKEVGLVHRIIDLSQEKSKLETKNVQFKFKELYLSTSREFEIFCQTIARESNQPKLVELANQHINKFNAKVEADICSRH